MESDRHLEALYLFKAGHWNHCHKLVIRHLASGECFTLGSTAPGITPNYSTLWTPWRVRPKMLMVWDMADMNQTTPVKALHVDEAWPKWGARGAGLGRMQYSYHFPGIFLTCANYVKLYLYREFYSQHQKYLFGKLKSEILLLLFLREFQITAWNSQVWPNIVSSSFLFCFSAMFFLWAFLGNMYLCRHSAQYFVFQMPSLMRTVTTWRGS